MDIKLNCTNCHDHKIFNFKDVSSYTKEEMTDGKFGICPDCGTKAIIRTSGMALHKTIPNQPLFQFVHKS